MGSCFVLQAGSELTVSIACMIVLPQPPKNWDYKSVTASLTANGLGFFVCSFVFLVQGIEIMACFNKQNTSVDSSARPKFSADEK